MNDGFTKEITKHGKGGNRKVVFTAKPTSYFIRTLSYGIGQLLFAKTPFCHQCIYPIGYFERKTRFRSICRRYLTQ